MKTGRILIILLTVVIAAGTIYFYFKKDDRPLTDLRTYLDEHAVLYHHYDSKTVERITHWRGGEADSENDLLGILPDSALAMHQVKAGRALVSWHLTRQKTLSPLYWIFTDENYELADDTFFEGKSVANLTEIKEPQKFFMAKGTKLIVLGTDGELMEKTAENELYAGSFLREFPHNQFEGNTKQAFAWLKKQSSLFRNVPVKASKYRLVIHKVQDAYYYKLAIDSIQQVCGDLNADNFHKNIPVSATGAVQYAFGDAGCIRNFMNDEKAQILWDAEDKYQFKFNSLIDAWVDGSITWMHCNFNGISEDIAMVKLRYDAAPFATGNRFFTEYETIRIKNGENKKNYTIARMLPDELSQICFGNSETTEKLYVTQLRDHLYFSQNKQALLMLLNELVNGQFVKGFSNQKNNSGRVFIRIPGVLEKKEMKDFENNWIIEGLAGITDEGILIQGSVFKQNN